ncbi:hypothetical protein FIBSPDRAFT_28004 [Athelia psychrophila]|uniref:F-box domain-containing protein n=1 Tax=Athelia psychrophila TaxID=1759441 RepID=A0A166G6G0_9AGAM|nr:hypothetical protein FIBSPDRAFT_28004 [Fibularhizoctonia sp. CBS 109695]
MASISICQEPRVERDRLWMLRKLEVDCTHVREPRLFDTFQAAPNLRIIDIADWGRPWHDIGQFPLLPWRQLQQVAFTGDVRDSLELLRLSPNLLVFKLTTDSDSDSLVGWNHIRHAFLRELAIDADNRGSSDFFGALTLPALVSLSYSGEEFPRDGITSMVNRSDISQSLDVFSLTLETIYEGVVPSIASKDIVEFL